MKTLIFSGNNIYFISYKQCNTRRVIEELNNWFFSKEYLLYSHSVTFNKLFVKGLNFRVQSSVTQQARNEGKLS